ncbi:hypothetical protein RA210_U10578 [Rubrivivax sp. A210]|uniref:helix-turn-helix transcriptional regulator n=1 Tax=Rubrivivax sp. A210 TaxID=2772301 RepID=UPI0019B01F40|nr:AlpA family phage regulatory protein [Rubrivivax sp. A210]CAD5366943.1 hypothetical protein RA210_U10578 [Rubrivivax sp. A210]
MTNKHLASCLLPATGYVRPNQLLGRPDPPAILPIAPATLWRWIKLGTFPAPVKLAPRITAFRVEDVRAWMAGVEQAQGPRP